MFFFSPPWRSVSESLYKYLFEILLLKLFKNEVWPLGQHLVRCLDPKQLHSFIHDVFVQLYSLCMVALRLYS